MGWRQAARYIVADASRDDERGRGRAATHHGHRSGPHDRLGPVGELRIVFEHGDVRVPGPDVRAVLRPQPDQLLAAPCSRFR